MGNTTVGHGGAILTVSLNALNCTFVGNTAGGNGGAIGADSDIRFATLEHCTVIANQARRGGGLHNRSTLRNSIVAANESTDGGDDIYGHATLQGCNLIGSNDSLSAASAPASPAPGVKNSHGHFVGSPALPLDPRLAALGLYGSDLPSMPPLPGSPVIDAADAADPPLEIDQLGNPRPSGPLPDIGAIEAFPFSTLDLEDTDADGIDDRLEPAYGFTVGVDESAVDTDGDGSPDGEELRNMSDPRDPADYLRLLSVESAGSAPDDGVTLRWSSFPGLDYDLLRVRDDGTLNPTPLPAGTAGDFTHALTIPRDQTTGLFRVRRN